jgi:hypothetical protein
VGDLFWKGSLMIQIKNIFNKDFVVSAAISIIIFSAFDKIGMTFNGMILSGAWSIGIVIINFIKEHKLNALATMSAAFSGIGLIGSIISKNPNFYLIAPIIQDILFAISQAVLRIILLYPVSISSYYAISTSYGSMSGPIAIVFCIFFHKWYGNKLEK